MPLNEREQKILEEIERQFYQEDPKLAQTVATTTLESVKRKWQRLAVVGFVVGVAVMLAFFTSSTVVALGWLCRDGGFRRISGHEPTPSQGRHHQGFLTRELDGSRPTEVASRRLEWPPSGEGNK